MSGLIPIPNPAGLGAGGVPAAAFLAEAQTDPVYGISTFTTVAEVLPYLQALANQLAADYPAQSGVKNKTAPDTRSQTLLAEIIAAT